MSASTTTPWDEQAVRRAIRLLGSQRTSASDPSTLARSLRLVSDIIARRGVTPSIFQLPGIMPMVAAGNGSVLLITYLDDLHAPAGDGTIDDPPRIDDRIVTGDGVVRAAGVVSAMGVLLGSPDAFNRVTLIVESDRAAGSAALKAWLASPDRKVSAAVWEATDLPVPPPAIYRGASGAVGLAIELSTSTPSDVESFYGGVLADPGHRLMQALAALKSADAEVLVPGFYDGVSPPDPIGIRALRDVSASVGAWLTRGRDPMERRLSASHLTLGSFLAPSITIREFHVAAAGPFLARGASATIEARIMPGQDIHAVQRAIVTFLHERIPEATMRTLEMNPSAIGWQGDLSSLSAIARVIPVAPGDSPAGMLEAIGVPTTGFSTVSCNPVAVHQSVSLDAVSTGTSMISALCELIAHAVAETASG
jgi:hypothetical protein